MLSYTSLKLDDAVCGRTGSAAVEGSNYCKREEKKSNSLRVQSFINKILCISVRRHVWYQNVKLMLMSLSVVFPLLHDLAASMDFTSQRS